MFLLLFSEEWLLAERSLCLTAVTDNKVHVVRAEIKFSVVSVLVGLLRPWPEVLLTSHTHLNFGINGRSFGWQPAKI